MKKDKNQQKSKKKFSWLRFILKSLMWFFIVVIALVIGIYYYLGAIVKEAVTRFVPPITGTTASVEHVDLSLLSGYVEIRDLKIGNPKGYSSNSIFKLGNITIKFDPKSVLSDKIVIDSVIIDQTAISAELKNLYSLDSNIVALQRNIENYTKSSTTEKKTETSKAKENVSTEKSSSKTVVIRDLQINNSKIHLGVEGQTASLVLPNIQQKNIGEKKKNETIVGIVADILDLISVESVKAVGKAAKDIAKKGFTEATGLITSGAGNVKDSAKGALKNLKGLF